MKLTGAFSTLLVVLPLLVAQAVAAPSSIQARAGRGGFNGGGFGGFGGQKGGNKNQNSNNKGGNNNNGGNNNANNSTANAGAAAGGAAGVNNANNANNGANNANNANNGGNNNANGGDLQSSLTLDPSVIGANLAQNGLGANGTEAGQAPSLTSTNNYINFCVDKTITDGLQIQDGSCNPVPMGEIPSKANQPACKFQFPVNMQNIQENTAFTIKMAIQGIQTGFFVNPNTNYFSAPQQVNGQGVIQGHSHVVIQAINGILDPNPADPQTFAFFKGLNDAAQGGVLTADVDKGLPAGTYRLFSINTASNHQPVLGPVAQHGSFDDAVYFTVGDAAGAQAVQDVASVSGSAAASAANNNNSTAASATAGQAANNNNAGAAQGANNATAAAGTAQGGNNANAGAAQGTNNSKGAQASGQGANNNKGTQAGAQSANKGGNKFGGFGGKQNAGNKQQGAQQQQQQNKGQQANKNGRRSISRISREH